MRNVRRFSASSPFLINRMIDLKRWRCPVGSQARETRVHDRKSSMLWLRWPTAWSMSSGGSFGVRTRSMPVPVTVHDEYSWVLNLQISGYYGPRLKDTSHKSLTRYVRMYRRSAMEVVEVVAHLRTCMKGGGDSPYKPLALFHK